MCKLSVFFQLIPAILITFLLNACGGGGGGGGGTTPPANLSGQFLDGPVSGLSYTTSSGGSGVTDTNGRFDYVSGDTVTFTVGGVTVGASTGKAFVSPLDLVSGGAANTQATNIVRFLMMLDSDGNPNNGLSISAGVQAKASTWANIDFATANMSTDVNVATILVDVKSIDPQASLPNSSTASNHLATTLQCAFGGGYKGTWASTLTTETGNWALYVDPFNGIIYGGAWDLSATPEAAGGMLFINGQLNTTNADNLVTTGTAGIATFGGTISPAGSVSGTWDDAPFSPDKGTFSGNRIALSLPAGTSGKVYRGISRGFDGNASTFIFAVDGSSVTGNGINLADNSTYTVTGTVTGNSFSGTATNSSGGAVSDINGSLNANGTINGNYFDQFPGSGSGSFNACAEFLVAN